MGFQPKNEFDASVVEYYKDYADMHGHLARATAILQKGITGMEHARLESFVVTTMAQVPAVPEVIKGEVPRVMEQDLLQITAAIGGAEIRTPASLVQLKCTQCGKMTPEYFMDTRLDAPLCPACFGSKQT